MSFKQRVVRLSRAYPNTFRKVWKIAFPIFRKDEMYFGSEYEDRSNSFEKIFAENRWLSNESRSGIGSTLIYTEPLRSSLEKILNDLNVKTLLDVPCGDFNWMRHVRLPPGTVYIGGDLVPDLISNLKAQAQNSRYSFQKLDIVEDPLPEADLWLCRDALFHLPNDDILKVLNYMATSNIRYFLSTTYSFEKNNRDIRPGGFRFINLRRPPFNLPTPLKEFDDFIFPHPPRSMGLWSREQILTVQHPPSSSARS